MDCGYFCELGYWGPDQRKERWKKQGKMLVQPAKVLHSLRVHGLDPDGSEDHTDYIVTDRPIGKPYTEEVKKQVSRPYHDPETGRRHGRKYRNKMSKIKFRLLEPDEVDSDIKKRALDMPWTDNLFDEGGSKVDLPLATALMDKAIDEAEEEGSAKKKGKP